MIVNEYDKDIQTDELLVKSVIGGDSTAFNKIIQRYHKRLLGWAYKIIRDPLAAEDIVQETFLRSFKGIGTCKNPKLFQTWLFSIAKNCALDWLDKKRSQIAKVRLDMKDLDELVVDSSNSNEQLDERLMNLRGAFKSLSSEMRVIVILKYWKGKSCEEISNQLKMPLGTVMSYLSRSYKFLKDRIYISEQKNHV